MLSKENNELLTGTNPGTPGGEFMRRYWHPVELSSVLKEDPVPVTIMGEELVLFRDNNGQPALIDRRCPHRGTDLSYGRVEGGGIRCLYHGWCMNSKGECIDQPAEPPSSNFKDSIHVTAYPCRELNGLILTYMGPGEPPLLPSFLQVPADRIHVGKMWHGSNFVQGNDGNIDPSHISFVHAFEAEQSDDNFAGGISYFNKDLSPTIEVEETGFGVRIHTKRKGEGGKAFLRVTNYIYPSLGMVGGLKPDDIVVNWHVPITDAAHWKYMITIKETGTITDEYRAFLDKNFHGEMTPDFRSVRNAENRFLQNREIMKTWSFAGIGDTRGSEVAAQDLLATESQGPVQDRTKEHLGYGDKAIAMSHHLMLRAIKQVQEGKNAPFTAFTEEENKDNDLVIFTGVIDNDENWTSAWRKKDHTVN